MWTAIGLVLSRSGASVEKVWRGNPAIKWAVLILVGLLALDLAAREALSLWRETIAVRKDAETVQSTIDVTNEKNRTDALTAKQLRGDNTTPSDQLYSNLKKYGPVDAVPHDPNIDTSPKAMQKLLLGPNK